MRDHSRWPLCLGENGFASAKDAYGKVYEQAEIWEKAVQLGYEGVELHGQYHPIPAPREELVALRQRARASGLRIAGFQTGGPNPCLGRAESAAYVDMLKRAIDAAVTLEADVVGCWPGPSMPQVAESDKIRALADAYRSVAPLAESAGVVLAMEPEPVVIADSIAIAMGVVNAVGSPAFTLIYDVAHATVLGQGDPVSVIKTFSPYIGHVHFTDADGSCRVLADGRTETSTHLAPGEGTVNLAAVLETLQESGYRSWVQADVWQHPDPWLAAEKNIRWLQRWMRMTG